MIEEVLSRVLPRGMKFLVKLFAGIALPYFLQLSIGWTKRFFTHVTVRADLFYFIIHVSSGICQELFSTSIPRNDRGRGVSHLSRRRRLFYRRHIYSWRNKKRTFTLACRFSVLSIGGSIGAWLNSPESPATPSSLSTYPLSSLGAKSPTNTASRPLT